MRLTYGHRPTPFHLSSTRTYDPDILLRRATRLIKNGQPVYLTVENDSICLGEQDLRLAAVVAASYHNQICYNIPSNDFWDEETQQMEAAAKAHMDASSSGDDCG